jgi:anti-sigma factor ChrR (cupin superfamily)
MNAQNAELLHANFALRVVIATHELPWTPSPQPGVERRMLDRVGGEVARATSLVRYAPASRFAAHEHGLGEEFLVLEGVFSDEHGDYPKGTYVRNPPGSRHTPHTGPGCIILVKLRQMPEAERQRVVVDTTATAWRTGDQPGVSSMPLYRSADGETVALERLDAGARYRSQAAAAGEELLLLEGVFDDGHGLHGPGTWIRNPAGHASEWHSTTGARYWVKRGHLPKAI